MVLSTQAADLYAGMDKAGQAVRTWANQTSTQVSSTFSRIGSITAGALGAAFAAASKFYHDAVATVKQLAEVGRHAEVLGIKSDVFQGLIGVGKKFGVEAETLDHALIHLAAGLEGGGKHATEFAKRLAVIGLDINDLKGQSIDKVFLSLADAVKEMPTPAQQAALALDLFGKEGARLLPILQQGKGAIEQFIAKQKEMGLIQSPEEMKAIREVRAELPKMAAMWEGLWNKVVVAALPAIKIVNENLNAALKSVGPVLNGIGEAAEGAFAVIAAGLRGATDMTQSWLAQMNEALAIWPKQEKAAMNWGDVVVSWTGQVGKALGYVWDALRAVVGLLEIAAGGVTKLFGYLVDGIKMLVDSIGQIPKEVLDTSWTKDASKSLSGFSKEVHKWGGALIDSGWNDQIKNFGKTAEEIEKKFDDWLGKRMLDRINQKPVVVPVVPKIEKPMDLSGVANNPAALKGSQEAYSIEAKYRFGGITDAAEKQLAEVRRTNDILQNGVVAGLNEIKDGLGSNMELGVV